MYLGMNCAAGRAVYRDMYSNPSRKPMCRSGRQCAIRAVPTSGSLNLYVYMQEVGSFRMRGRNSAHKCCARLDTHCLRGMAYHGSLAQREDSARGLPAAVAAAAHGSTMRAQWMT